MPQYYQMSAGSSKPLMTQPGSCPASTVQPLADHRYPHIQSLADHRYPHIQPLADHRYPHIQPLADHRYPHVHPLADHRYPHVHPLADHRYPHIQPLADHRYPHVHPLADHRYPHIHPFADHRYPAHERNYSSSFTRRQFLQNVQAVEKSRDHRRQMFMQKNNIRHYIQVTEAHGQDKTVPVPSGLTNKVPTVGRQAAQCGLTSRPEKAWTPFYHSGNTQRSVNIISTDKSPSTQRIDQKTTEDQHTLETRPPEQQTAPLTSNNLPSSRRPSRLPSITYEDHSTTSQSRNATLHVPPILLPRIYTQVPRPLQYREFLTGDKAPAPITDQVWEELKQCRYIRHAVFGGPRRGYI